MNTGADNKRRCITVWLPRGDTEQTGVFTTSFKRGSTGQSGNTHRTITHVFYIKHSDIEKHCLKDI